MANVPLNKSPDKDETYSTTQPPAKTEKTVGRHWDESPSSAAERALPSGKASGKSD